MRAVPTDGLLQWLMKLSLKLCESYEKSRKNPEEENKANWKRYTNPLVKDLSKCEGCFSFWWPLSENEKKTK